MEAGKESSEKGVDYTKPEAGHVEGLPAIASHQDVDSPLDAQIDRKFDLHIVPWLFGIW